MAKINLVWILVQADRTGFSNLLNNNFFSFYFASLDCTGAKYLAAYGLPPVGQVITNNTQLLFPAPGLVSAPPGVVAQFLFWRVQLKLSI
jgi:hypothetical protein